MADGRGLAVEEEQLGTKRDRRASERLTNGLEESVHPPSRAIGALLVASLFVLTACGATGPEGAEGADTPSASAFLGTWRSDTVSEDYPSELNVFDDGRYQVQGPCNRTGGSWDVDDGELNLDASNSDSTAVGCLIEEPVLSSTGPLSLDTDGGTLTMPTAAGALVFERVPTG